MRYLHLEWVKGQIRDEKTSQTVIGVTDENFNLSNVISDLVMPYKIKITKYFKYVYTKLS